MSSLKNNRGASLVIVIAIMALFMVLGLNVIMSAYNMNSNLSEDYDSEKVDLYVSSVFRTVDNQICTGAIADVFTSAGDTEDKANIVDLTGFTYQGNPVSVKLVCMKTASKMGQIDYYITIKNSSGEKIEEYKLVCTYLVKGTTISSYGCSGIESGVEK